MKKLFILVIFLVCSNTAFADSGVSVVFVNNNNEIVISTDNTGQIELTHNGIPKDFPVWSKDGSMVAFTEQTDEKVALDRLVVINRDGKRLFSFLIHPRPTGPNDVEEFGMQYVEQIEWVTNSKVAVSGSINPSTGENIVFDLSTGKISNDFFDDGGVAYSPDGRHVAYITGVPHFTPKSEERPVLNIDDNEHIVYPPSGTNVNFISHAAWSGDSQTLAIVATDKNTKMSSIVMWHPGNELSVIPLKTTLNENNAKLFWNGDAVIVTSDKQAWSFAQNKLSEISLSKAVNPKKEALNSRHSLLGSLGGGAVEPDFWCQSCPLSLLPRKNPNYDYNHER